jgi:Domain of unknown function (DUF1707)
VARYGGTAVTDAGRDAAAAQLREHYAAGRLSLDQFQDRLDEAYRAQTARELNAVTDGLPHVSQVIPSGAPWGGDPGGYPFNVADRRAALARTGRRIMRVLGMPACCSPVAPSGGYAPAWPPAPDHRAHE